MAEYLQIRSNGQITLPAPTRRKAKLNEGDLLEVLVEEDGSIRLVPKLPVDRALPAATRRKAKLHEGDLLEAVVETDGSIRLVPKTPVDRKLAEQYQMKDIQWALKQKKGSKK